MTKVFSSGYGSRSLLGFATRCVPVMRVTHARKVLASMRVLCLHACVMLACTHCACMLACMHACMQAAGGFPLSALGYWLFTRTGLMSQFGISGRQLASFLRSVEAGYLDNP